MTLTSTENYLKNLIKEAVSTIKLKNKNGIDSEISVLTGLLPPKNFYKDINEYPFILLRTHKNKKSLQNKEYKKNFVVYVGVCAEQENRIQNPNTSNIDLSNYEEGHKDLNNVYEKIEDMLSDKQFFGDSTGSFRIETIDFEAFLEQPFPYFLGQISIEIAGNF